jgi:hypothetical protein
MKKPETSDLNSSSSSWARSNPTAYFSRALESISPLLGASSDRRRPGSGSSISTTSSLIGCSGHQEASCEPKSTGRPRYFAVFQLPRWSTTVLVVRPIVSHSLRAVGKRLLSPISAISVMAVRRATPGEPLERRYARIGLGDPADLPIEPGGPAARFEAPVTQARARSSRDSA